MSRMSRIADYDAFVSWHISDLPLATRTVTTLERAGISTWWDRGVRDNPAQGTVTEILSQLALRVRQCKYLVFIASLPALGSAWVRAEVETFIDQSKPAIVWHPREDASALHRLMASVPGDTRGEVTRVLGSPNIIAEFDRPRTDVDFVSKNIATLLRFFKHVEGKGLVVSRDTFTTEYPKYVHDDMDFLMTFLAPEP